MDATFFIRGLIIGFSIAAPVGPIGIVCIRRTLANGRLVGFVSGMGAASADAIYGAISAFGLTTISGFLVGQQLWMRLIGGFFLTWLGFKTLRSVPAPKDAESIRPSGLVSYYLSIFFLTLTNPMTILSFAAIFAGLGLAQTGGDYALAAQLVAGVFLGSAAWWLTLSLIAGLFREKITLTTLLWINRGAGVAIILFGIISVGSLFSM
jgi:threonine/homoserine/homoserine lactone efflux protein